MSSVVTFDSQPPEGTINFGIGQPSADLLPLQLVKQASERFFKDALPIELNYGVIEGDARFLESLAEYLSHDYGVEADPDELVVTSGCSQGLSMSSFMFARPGDTVIVEEPCYFLAYQIFHDHGLNIVSVPMDEEGMNVDALRHELESVKPAFLYTISSYHNPTGQCTSEARRRQLVEIAAEHDFLIVADEVYQLLNYNGSPPPAYGTMTDSDRVVSLGSFSKILAPGIRLGWVQTSPRLRQHLLNAGYINSGGSLNHFASHIVRQAINDGSLRAHVKHLRRAYGSRLQAMDDALNEHFAGIAEWDRPGGGYFVWVRFDPDLDTTPLRQKAPELEAGFQHGAVFSMRGIQKNCIRLCFAHYGEEDIAEGIARIRPLFD
jgi:DNA-binding transcriptional MocR family regulator